MNSTNFAPPPPIPPRQIKSDDKTTTPPLVLVKQSHPVNACFIDNNNVNTTKGLSIYSKIMNKKKNFCFSIETSNEVISNGHHIDEDNDQTLLIQTLPSTLTNG